MSYQDISNEWRLDNNEIRLMSEQCTQMQFGLQKLQKCMATEFRIVSFMTQTQHHVNKLYKNPEQFPFNRNSGFMTFEPSRVIIGPQADKDKIQNYINANLIQVEAGKVIATQAPLTSTFYNFWKMVEQYSVPSIFMLCNFIEKTKMKCDRYYPYGDNTTITIKQYEVTLVEQKESSALKIKYLKLKNTETNNERIIKHYQLTNWGDGQKPKAGDKNLSYLLLELVKYIKEGAIPVVHCSAGVGRTGTLICMAVLKILIQNGRPISVFNQVRKLKEQRWGMVYTPSQYEYLYDFAEKEIDRLNNAIQNGSSGSQQDLEKD